MNASIRLLLGYLKNYKTSLLVVLTALLVVAISLLLLGMVFRRLVDQGLTIGGAEVNHSIFLIAVLIGIFAIGSFFRSYFINLVAEKTISQIKADSYRNLLGLEVVAFEELKIGDIISRLGPDLETVGTLITNFLSFFIRNFIMLLGAVMLMIFQSPKLSILVIGLVPALLLPMLRFGKHVRELSKKVMAEKAELFSCVDETFSAVRTYCAFNQQHYAVERFNKKVNTCLTYSAARLKLRALFFALAIAIIAGSIIMVIWIGSMDIVSGRMTSGQMISFIYYSLIAGMSAGGIAELFSGIQSPMAALDRVFELQSWSGGTKGNISYTENPYPAARTTKDHIGYMPQSLAGEGGIISFEDVSFSYPARPEIPVLNKISFAIQQGRFTGIVGKSGSGKSTIMLLLLGFYPHQRGKISFAGSDITSYNPHDIRKLIGYVEQDPAIFSGTIKSNIMFSNPEAPDEEVNNIVKICGIDKFVSVLPGGLYTEIGEKGIRLSGGQKQRLAIARTLLYKPEILLLDEATSALDSKSEKQILDNIRKYMGDKTIISIAHRISSTQNADNIIVVDGGRVVSSGTHHELLKTCRIYSSLFKGIPEL